MRTFVQLGATALIGMFLAGTGTALAGSTGASNVPGTRAGGEKTVKEPLALTDAQRQQVRQAVASLETDDKLPPGFTPTVGAKVPTQKKLPLHPLPQDLSRQIPALKQYYYGKLPDNILIVDPMTKKVVDVIPR
jgi:hypothetical protein